MNDVYRYEAEQERKWQKMLAKQPVCEVCGNHIAPDEMYFEDGGAYYHTDCLISASKIMMEVGA